MRGMKTRVLAAGTAAAIALTVAAPLPSAAAPATKPVQTVPGVQVSESTEFSARKRVRRHRNSAAAAAMMAAVIGGIATYAAAREYRKARERELHYRYGYAPYPYYGYRSHKRYYYYW